MLRIPDTVQGRLGRCPKCQNVVTIRDGKDSAAGNERQSFTERPSDGVGRRRDDPEPGARRGRPREDNLDEVVEEYVEDDVVREEYVEDEQPRSRRQKSKPPQDDSDEVVEEYVEDEEPRPKRRKKKRKQRRLQSIPGQEEEREIPAWVWLVGGGAGIVLTYVALIMIVMMAPAEGYLRFCAMRLIISLPISTVIFFGALIAASMIVGAVEIGEIHVAVCKSFGLILAVSIVGLIPFIGRYLTPLVWIPGLMLLFRLDFWETCMVMVFNWIPNFLLNLALGIIFLQAALHGGGGIGIDRDQPPTKTKPADDGHIWDEDDVKDLGGIVEYDRNNPNVVVSISFREVPIGDAEMAHMKDFPRLMRLTLARTQVTDAGLKHLAACKQLIWLDVSDTFVTPAGTRELQKALPNLRIFP